MSLENKTIAFIGGGHITEIIAGNLIGRMRPFPDDPAVLRPPCNPCSIKPDFW